LNPAISLPVLRLPFIDNTERKGRKKRKKTYRQKCPNIPRKPDHILHPSSSLNPYQQADPPDTWVDTYWVFVDKM